MRLLGSMKSSGGVAPGNTPMDNLAREMREQVAALKAVIFEQSMEIERLHGKLGLLRQDSRSYRTRTTVALTVLRDCSPGPRTTALLIEALEGTLR